ncbi:MAG: hypothetical protein JXR94_09115 [Candidatus Hydrogenedentes bacterium]|nr:hypothetical protein [Candidatus Hydrogenedentota bacterium]
MGFHSNFRRSRRRREILFVSLAAALIIASGVVLTPLLRRLGERSPHAPAREPGALNTISEAMAVADVLGDSPNDDKLIEAIKDPQMQGRTLAIEFLGEGGYGDALPVLEGIVRDPNESARYRVAALEAIFLIAGHQGRTLAQEYENDGTLGATARRILYEPDTIRDRPSRVKSLLNAVKF